MESRIKVIRGEMVSVLTNQMKGFLKKDSNSKFVLITNFKSISELNRLQRFPVLDILIESAEEESKSITKAKKNFEKLNSYSDQLFAVQKEKIFEQKLSNVHLLVSSALLFYLFFQYVI